MHIPSRFILVQPNHEFMPWIHVYQWILDHEIRMAMRTGMTEDVPTETQIPQIRILLCVDAFVSMNGKLFSAIRTLVFYFFKFAHDFPL